MNLKIKEGLVFINFVVVVVLIGFLGFVLVIGFLLVGIDYSGLDYVVMVVCGGLLFSFW